MSHDLDAIDRKILHELQAAGRATNVEIAAKVHLSAPQCFRRVRSLEERGTSPLKGKSEPVALYALNHAGAEPSAEGATAATA